MWNLSKFGKISHFSTSVVWKNENSYSCGEISCIEIWNFSTWQIFSPPTCRWLRWQISGMGGSIECFVALCTLVALLSAVNEQVSLQISSLTELFAAISTFVWLRLAVNELEDASLPHCSALCVSKWVFRCPASLNVLLHSAHLCDFSSLWMSLLSLQIYSLTDLLHSVANQHMAGQLAGIFEWLDTHAARMWVCHVQDLICSPPSVCFIWSVRPLLLSWLKSFLYYFSWFPPSILGQKAHNLNCICTVRIPVWGRIWSQVKMSTMYNLHHDIVVVRLFSSVWFIMSPQIAKITLFFKILWLSILSVSPAFTLDLCQAKTIHLKLNSWGGQSWWLMDSGLPTSELPPSGQSWGGQSWHSPNASGRRKA